MSDTVMEVQKKKVMSIVQAAALMQEKMDELSRTTRTKSTGRKIRVE